MVLSIVQNWMMNGNWEIAFCFLISLVMFSLVFSLCLFVPILTSCNIFTKSSILILTQSRIFFPNPIKLAFFQLLLLLLLRSRFRLTTFLLSWDDLNFDGVYIYSSLPYMRVFNCVNYSIPPYSFFYFFSYPRPVHFAYQPVYLIAPVFGSFFSSNPLIIYSFHLGVLYNPSSFILLSSNWKLYSQLRNIYFFAILKLSL